MLQGCLLLHLPQLCPIGTSIPCYNCGMITFTSRTLDSNMAPSSPSIFTDLTVTIPAQYSPATSQKEAYTT